MKILNECQKLLIKKSIVSNFNSARTSQARTVILTSRTVIITM
jgi:hypothetical protein